jgi:hypothetical protein
MLALPLRLRHLQIGFCGKITITLNVKLFYVTLIVRNKRQLPRGELTNLLRNSKDNRNFLR